MIVSYTDEYTISHKSCTYNLSVLMIKNVKHFVTKWSVRDEPFYKISAYLYLATNIMEVFGLRLILMAYKNG